jgi:hypothetical protein
VRSGCDDACRMQKVPPRTRPQPRQCGPHVTLTTPDQPDSGSCHHVIETLFWTLNKDATSTPCPSVAYDRVPIGFDHAPADWTTNIVSVTRFGRSTMSCAYQDLPRRAKARSARNATADVPETRSKHRLIRAPSSKVALLSSDKRRCRAVSRVSRGQELCQEPPLDAMASAGPEPA